MCRLSLAVNVLDKELSDWTSKKFSHWLQWKDNFD